jgi:hypothetical protein
MIRCSDALAVTALMLLTPGSSSAAAIKVAGSNSDGVALITLKGEMVQEDIDRFQQVASQVQRAVVSLESPGGTLVTGLDIGTTIRLRNFTTVIPDRARCASSCAFAWLGGTSRHVAPSAQVGFHAAWRLVDGKPTEAGTGNALLGAYLNRIALSDKAILYITSAPPEGMRWLNPADAKSVGIDVHERRIDLATFLPKPPMAEVEPQSQPKRSQPLHLSRPAAPQRSAGRASLTGHLVAATFYWGAYAGTIGTEKRCFARTAAVGFSSPDDPDISLWSGHGTSEPARREAVFGGLRLRSGDRASVEISGKAFPLVQTAHGAAYLETIGAEKDLVDALFGASQLVVNVQRHSGAVQVFSFVLTGMASAIADSDTACRGSSHKTKPVRVGSGEAGP